MQKSTILVLERLAEALRDADHYRGSLANASSYANAACAFRAFLNLLPDSTFDKKEQEEVSEQLMMLYDRARSRELFDFATYLEDVCNELSGEHHRHIRKHW